MRPSKESVFRLMARLEQSGALPDAGPTSVFVSDLDGGLRRHPTQLAVHVSGDAVFVQISRLSFVRPYVYSRQALRVARV